MKKVTIFKNIFETTDPLFVDVSEIFKRIKDGNSKGIVGNIRDAKIDQEYQNLKKRLPSICFSGRFSKRSSESLLEHSGLICLDVDKIEKKDLLEIKKLIIDDPYCYAVFISPGGLGLKIIVQIDNIPKHHKGQFMALEDYYNEKLKSYTSTQKIGSVSQPVCIDKSGKDVNRVCYESFDQDIYYNEDSHVWDEIKTVDEFEKEVTDHDKVIELLQKWIDKKDDYFKGNRNNYLYKLASALCRFGVIEIRAFSYMSSRFSDFAPNEMQTLIKSAYRGNHFGSQEFTETEKRTGHVKTNIDGKKDVTAFWSINDKGRVKIDSKQFLKFIEANGFGIYRHSKGSEKWQFVQVKNMIVDIVDVVDIKKNILEYVENHATEIVFDELQNKNRYFEKTYLNALPLIDVEQIRDKKESTYIFFENFYYEVTKNGPVYHSYIDLEGRHIWKTQICKRTINKVVEFRNHDFMKFVARALGGKSDILSGMTAIGYGIHTYKKKRLAKLIYASDASDAELDGMAAGGSGKNLFFEALSFVRSVVNVDGKDFDKKDKFKFQTVNDDTQIVSIDDYEGDIKELFTRITGHFEVEKKGLDKTVIEFEAAPKIFVSSNSAPKGFSDSFSRRLHELNFTDHYNSKHTPSDEFGDKDFFSDDWTQNDYDAFYSFMFKCCELYFIHGLVGGVGGAHNKYKQLVKNVGREFADYFMDKEINWDYGKQLHAEYLRESGDDLKIQSFYGNVRRMASLYGWNYVSKGSGDEKQIKITKN